MELKLPTLAVPVRLAMTGQAAVAAEIFVVDVARATRGQLLDDIAALFDEDASFVPVRLAGGVALVAKHAVSWLAVARGAELDEVALYDHEHRVEIALAVGDALRGTLFDSGPAARPRVVDHLNRAGRFVRLWTDADHVLVNKAQIVCVRELE